MFTMEDICVLCEKELTPVRSHWCVKKFLYVILETVLILGDGVRTDIIRDCVKDDKFPFQIKRYMFYKMVKKLVDKDYIEVRDDFLDGRHSNFLLTPKGINFYNSIENELNEEVLSYRKEIVDYGYKFLSDLIVDRKRSSIKLENQD